MEDNTVSNLENIEKRFVPLYLVVDSNNIVSDITYEETEYYYQDVIEGIDIETIKEEIGLNDGTYKFENSALLKIEVDKVKLLESELNSMKAQLMAERRNNETQMLEIMELMMGMI